jgi:hypothetical protein
MSLFHSILLDFFYPFFYCDSTLNISLTYCDFSYFECKIFKRVVYSLPKNMTWKETILQTFKFSNELNDHMLLHVI